MAVRIGMGLGLGGFPFESIAEFRAWLDFCEDSTIDSIWQSDRVVSRDPALEPIALLSMIAGATRRLKLGTNAIVLPFRDPITFARQCATLDHLSDGRLLPTVAVGRDDAPEWAATGRSPKGRGERVDEALEVMTRLWASEVADFDGRHYSLKGASIAPRPKQSPLPLWIGGASPGAIRRTIRFGNGWLAPLQSPAEAGATVATIRAQSIAAGRPIPEDHYGATFLFRIGPGSGDFPLPIRRDADSEIQKRIQSVQAIGDAKTVLDRIREFRAGGITKFIAIPLARSAAEMLEQSRLLAAEVIPPRQRLKANAAGPARPAEDSKVSLFRFLGLAVQEEPGHREPESLREIGARLSALAPEDARFIAAFAYLLARVAGADLKTEGGERDAIAERLETVAGLERERAHILADAAIAAAVTHSASDDHLVARSFREMASDVERQRLVHCLYAVAAADSNITTVEDNEIFEIATEIGMGRSDVIALRTGFKEHLAVLRALPRER